MKEFREFVDFVISFGEAYDQARQSDGKIDWRDIPLLFSPATKLPPAVDGIGLIYDELKNMTDEQRQIEVDWAKEQFDITNDAAEALIERAYKWALDTFDLFNDLSGILLK